MRCKINCLPGGRARGIRSTLFTFPQDAREVASERDVGSRARPANGIPNPSSTSQLRRSYARSKIVVGGCGSDAISRGDLVINVKLVATRGGDRKHAWPTPQNSSLECGAYLKCIGYGWVRCKCSTLSQVVVQYSIYLAPYTRKVCHMRSSPFPRSIRSLGRIGFSHHSIQVYTNIIHCCICVVPSVSRTRPYNGVQCLKFG